jgi:hypothetical protein
MLCRTPADLQISAKALLVRDVRVFVGAALPGAVGIGKVDLQLGVDAQLGVLGQFRAAVPGQ